MNHSCSSIPIPTCDDAPGGADGRVRDMFAQVEHRFDDSDPSRTEHVPKTHFQVKSTASCEVAGQQEQFIAKVEKFKAV